MGKLLGSRPLKRWSADGFEPAVLRIGKEATVAFRGPAVSTLSWFAGSGPQGPCCGKLMLGPWIRLDGILRQPEVESTAPSRAASERRQSLDGYRAAMAGCRPLSKLRKRNHPAAPHASNDHRDDHELSRLEVGPGAARSGGAVARSRAAPDQRPRVCSSVEQHLNSRGPRGLSNAALEVLANVAYRQPSRARVSSTSATRPATAPSPRCSSGGGSTPTRITSW